MLFYTISCPEAERLNQIIEVRLSFEITEIKALSLELPAWRPGRYEFQNYAKNIFGLKAYGADKLAVEVHKMARNTWELKPSSKGMLTVSYYYSCTQLDAGGSWIDDELFYINPINCLLYIKGREEVPCQLSLDVPDMEHVAGNLSFKQGVATVENYFRLADSPFFTSKQPGYDSYTLYDCTFHIWTHGQVHYDQTVLKQDFIRFTEAQIRSMAGFPEKEYHFLLLLLPFRHYHGVEHHQSTVITLGPSSELTNAFLYEELISISSHELYHAWNICKIRPKELYPYRLHEENFFRTGFVAEGITTYLGEYFLRQSGFFSEERFLQEIEQWLNRHRLHRGLERASLAESSFDLWVDGYLPGSADYKVSIYVAGALSAIALDLLIRLHNQNTSILDMMRALYEQKAQNNEGYSEQDLKALINAFSKGSEHEFWEMCITGHETERYVIGLLHEFGIRVVTKSSDFVHERIFGIKLKPGSKNEIGKLKQGSPSSNLLMPDDVILSINKKAVADTIALEEELKEKTEALFLVHRKGREKTVYLKSFGKNYWDHSLVEKNSEASAEQKLRYKEWLGTIQQED